MKKIKITEQQAKMLKELDKKKVLKITQEQYNKILKLEQLNETSLSDPITREFQKNLSSGAKKDIRSTRLPESIKEMYKEFINELYSINEGSEKKYEKLIKLMETSGLIKRNKIVKEKFNGDKSIVEYVICEGLYEMSNGSSHYRAMERIEEALSDYNSTYNITSLQRQAKQIPTEKEIEDKLDYNRNRELYRRKKEESDWKKMLNTSKQLEEMDNYPMGASDDPRAPFNQTNNLSNPITSKNIIYTVEWYDGYNAILKKGDELFLFNMGSVSKDDYSEYAKREITTDYDEEGPYSLYSDEFEVNKDVIERYINDNLINLSIGNGYQAYEQGIYDIVKFDDELKELFSDELSNVSTFNEVTSASSSGSYTGLFSGEKYKSNVSDEIDGLLTNETEVESGKVNIHIDNSAIYIKIINLLQEIINSRAVVPSVIKEKANELKIIIGFLIDLEYSSEQEKLIYGKHLPEMIKKLISCSKMVHKDFGAYIEQIRKVYDTLEELKKDLNNIPSTLHSVMEEQGIGSVGAYDTNPFNDTKLGPDNKEGKGSTHKQTMIPGGSFVEINDKCKKFSYCNLDSNAIVKIVAEETGRTIKEVKQIINNFKQL